MPTYCRETCLSLLTFSLSNKAFPSDTVQFKNRISFEMTWRDAQVPLLSKLKDGMCRP